MKITLAPVIAPPSSLANSLALVGITFMCCQKSTLTTIKFGSASSLDMLKLWHLLLLLLRLKKVIKTVTGSLKTRSEDNDDDDAGDSSKAPTRGNAREASSTKSTIRAPSHFVFLTRRKSKAIEDRLMSTPIPVVTPPSAPANSLAPVVIVDSSPSSKCNVVKRSKIASLVSRKRARHCP